MMNTGGFWWVLALSAASVAIWAIFIIFIPNCLCSLFRYRLWGLRDTVKDEILQGQLPDQQLVQGFLSAIETSILFAERLTLVQVLLLPSNMRSVQRQRQKFNHAIQQLDEKTRKRFLAHHNDLLAIFVTRLFIGSITGWAFLALLVPAITVMLFSSLAQRASLSITDALLTALRWIEKVLAKTLRKDPDLDWQGLAERIRRMRKVAPRPKTLSECVA